MNIQPPMTNSIRNNSQVFPREKYFHTVLKPAIRAMSARMPTHFADLALFLLQIDQEDVVALLAFESGFPPLFLSGLVLFFDFGIGLLDFDLGLHFLELLRVLSVFVLLDELFLGHQLGFLKDLLQFYR